MGRFTMAAKHHQSIAEMFENEANDLVSMNFLFNCLAVHIHLRIFDPKKERE
jgi:hypothetical protein